jgi:iron complex outermembrane recepter protein
MQPTATEPKEIFPPLHMREQERGPRKGGRIRRRGRRALSVLLAILIAFPALAFADIKNELNIPAQDLGSALKALSAAANEQLLFSDTVVASRRSATVEGKYTTDDALAILLRGTGLKVVRTKSGVLLVRPIAYMYGSDNFSQPISDTPPESPSRISEERPGVRLAQTDQRSPASTEAGENDALQEVVVTARLRSENVMQVPDTITVFSPTEIAERQLVQLEDFIHLTPNAKMIREQDIATSELYIRGVGSNKGQASAIAYVVDGVILPNQDAYTMDLSDAEQVEILKGPQGALYGKGALAGVVNIKTRAPTDEFHYDGKLDVGTNNTNGFFSAVSGPIIGDSLLGSLNAKFNKTDGYFNNTYDNLGLERDENWKISGKLIAHPSDRLTFELATSYFQQHSGNPPYNGVDVLGTGSAQITSNEAARPISHNSPDRDHRSVFTTALTSSLALPFGTLTSITAYDAVSLAFQQEADFTALNVAMAEETRHSHGVNQEIRFTSPADQRFRYIVSAYYEKTEDDVYLDGYLDFCFLGVVVCTTPPGVQTGLTPLHLTNSKLKSDEYAGSANISYDLTKELELTLGLRYDRDKPDQNDILHSLIQTTTFSDWQPKASLAYKPTQDLTAYVTYSHGYKAGLFNPPQPAGSPFPERVKQERTDNVEIGTKASFLDRRLLLNAAAFHTNYDNAQEYHLDLQSGGNQAININNATIVGFETSVTARPLNHFQVDASYGYTRSKINNFNGTQAYVGQSLPYAPRYTLNLGAEYSYPFANDLTLKARVDYNRDGKESFQDFQNPNSNQFLYQNSDQTVDLHVSLSKDRWTFTAYGKNVFDSRYVYSAYSRYISTLIFGALKEDALLPAPGTTFGVEIRVSF